MPAEFDEGVSVLGTRKCSLLVGDKRVRLRCVESPIGYSLANMDDTEGPNHMHARVLRLGARDFGGYLLVRQRASYGVTYVKEYKESLPTFQSWEDVIAAMELIDPECLVWLA